MKLSATRPQLLDELGADLVRELHDVLAEQGIKEAAINGRARGGTSVCYFIGTGGSGGSLVLKRPTHGEDLGEEYAALRAAAAAGEALAMRLPHPFARLSAETGYLMERVRGEPLRSPRALRDTSRIESFAAAVIDAVTSYHNTIGQPFGDFHAANVFVQADGSPAFIDPGRSSDVARATVNWAVVTPMAFDLGLWLYNTALDTPSAFRHSPATAARLCRFALLLLHEACSRPGGGSEGLRTDTFDTAFRHARRLWSDPWPARRLRAPATFAVLAALRCSANGRER